MLDMRDFVQFVLVRTTHPGNIGASARAIKNMGFNGLTLVAPNYFPHDEATVRASGAEDILQNAKVVPDLDSAIGDCEIVIGTSARSRSVEIPLLTANEAAAIVHQEVKLGKQVGLIFGQERTGLTNEELARCHYHLFIPCNPQFASLNLGAAVQIVAYELRLALSDQVMTVAPSGDFISAEALERFYAHLEETLVTLKFLNPENPRQLMRKLRRLFNRVQLEQNEMNILRGILTAINRHSSQDSD